MARVGREKAKTKDNDTGSSITHVEDDRRKEAGMTEEGKDDSDVKIQ